MSVDDWTQWPCIIGRRRQSRQVWMKVYGDPGELWVLHRCTNSLCREPRHLYLGTPSQNIRDAIRAGTWTSPLRRPEVMAKSIASRTGQPLSAQHRSSIALGMLGSTRTEQQREAMSRAQVKAQNRPEVRLKRSASMSKYHERRRLEAQACSNLTEGLGSTYIMGTLDKL